MGGLPQVVALRAVAVATALAALTSGAALADQIRAPLPGSDAKPKVLQRQLFRPTMPRRNPTRTPAEITASIRIDDASSPISASGDGASGMAGAASSATAAVELAAVVPSEPETTSALAEGADTEAMDTNEEPAGDASGPDAETAETSPDESAPATAEAEDTEPVAEETGAIDQPDDTMAEADAEADTASVDTSSDAAEPEKGEGAETAEDSADALAETSESDTETASLDEPAETIADAAETAPSPPPSEDAMPEPAAQEKAELPAEPVEIEIAEEAEESAEATETVEAEPAEAEQTAEQAEPAEAPSHGASVVIAVQPPPDEVVRESAGSPDTAESPSDAEPVEMAAVAPSEVVPVSPPAADEEPAATEAEPATDGDETPPAEAAETPPSDEVTPDETETDAAPPPPPADPIVAQVRANLEDAELRKQVAASDLEALKAFYGTHEGPPLWVTEEGFSPKAQALIAEIEKADDWGLDAGSYELPPANDLLATSNAQADDELQLSIAVLSYARDAQIGHLTPSRVSKLFDQRPALRDPEKVLTEIAAANEPDAYLTSLHPQQEQFKQLHKALIAARARAEANDTDPRNDREVQRLVINMERWRWMPRSLGSYYVWNNVPEFETHVIKNGRTIYEEKIIVGQMKYATPFFSAPMRNVVFHPNWTVPPTIIKEDLAPKLQGDGGFFGNANTAVLRNHGLSVSYKGEPVDPNSVDWKNVNIHKYTFTQAPGPANVLGRFKFNFPNKHAIYMHDTVQPELFAQTQRTLSHGCIRVHDPGRFAALLLAEDRGWSAGQVKSTLAKNETNVVMLKRPVPVHLTYFTIVADENGMLKTFDDIYNIDNRMAAALFDRPANFYVPPPVAEAPSSARDRRASRGGGGLDDLISGLFGN
jgi:murein L,D-transpeptidase YcbB/YkuD